MFEIMVAVRYLIDEKKQTAFIILACAVGVAVMVFLYGLISGLQASLIDKTLGSQPHIVSNAHKEKPRAIVLSNEKTTVIGSESRGFDRPQYILDWKQKISSIENIEGVVAAAPHLRGAALVKRGDIARSVMMNGVDAESFGRIIPVKKKIIKGKWDLPGVSIVIGKTLAEDLGVVPGDRIQLSTAVASDFFTVTGIFDLGSNQINDNWVFVPLNSAQSFMALEGEINSIDMKVDSIFSASKIARTVEKRTSLQSLSWMETNSQLLIALRSQSSSSYMIQFFVMVAVALGIASVLIVSVVQKRREIAIMLAFGTARRQIVRIFLYQGAIVGFTGSVIGSVMGTALAEFFRSISRNPDGTPQFPIEIEPLTYMIMILIATLVGLVSAAMPAKQASKVDPATVIH